MSVKFGVLGAARIAPRVMSEPIAAGCDAAVVIVGARDPERAKAFAATHPGSAWGTYADVIAHPEVDCVYIPLPIARHAEWAILALEAGKHVLVEKAFTMNAAETRAVQAAAAKAGKRAIEAAHYRYHPLMARLLALCANGVTRIEAEFAVPVRDTPDEIRRDPAAGGGCLLDIGYYPVHLVRTLMGMPKVERAGATWTDRGVDESLWAELSFANGASARISCGMALTEQPRATARIETPGGLIQVMNFVAPQIGAALRVNGVDEEVPKSATFTHQMQAVIAALETGAPVITEGADVLAQSELLDAILAAAPRP